MGEYGLYNGQRVKAIHVGTKTGKAVKYVPELHGYWDMASDGDGVVCSVCGTDFCVLINDTDKFYYCPNCGAKMDGGAANAD